MSVIILFSAPATNKLAERSAAEARISVLCRCCLRGGRVLGHSRRWCSTGKACAERCLAEANGCGTRGNTALAATAITVTQSTEWQLNNHGESSDSMHDVTPPCSLCAEACDGASSCPPALAVTTGTGSGCSRSLSSSSSPLGSSAKTTALTPPRAVRTQTPDPESLDTSSRSVPRGGCAETRRKGVVADRLGVV